MRRTAMFLKLVGSIPGRYGRQKCLFRIFFLDLFVHTRALWQESFFFITNRALWQDKSIPGRYGKQKCSTQFLFFIYTRALWQEKVLQEKRATKEHLKRTQAYPKSTPRGPQEDSKRIQGHPKSTPRGPQANLKRKQEASRGTSSRSCSGLFIGTRARKS